MLHIINLNTYSFISLLQLQELGQPPKDLVGDVGPAMQLDGSGNPVLPDAFSLLNAAGFSDAAKVGQDEASNTTDTAESSEQCSIM